MYPGQGQDGMFQESFPQGHEWQEATWYQLYGQSPQEACTNKKHCNLCKKHGVKYTMHNTKDCHRYEKDGKEKANFCAAKKGGKKPNPARQNLTQLSKKVDKLEKSLKKANMKSKKRQYEDSNSNSE